MFDIKNHEEYEAQVSWDLQNPAWDSFLEACPGGSFVQTSLWGQVKAKYGWKPLRLLITRENQIVAGAQFLLREIGPFGYLAYVTKGPVISSGEPKSREFILQNLRETIQMNRIQYLILQPPDNAEDLVNDLKSMGFHRNRSNLVYNATLLLDLNDSLENILGNMRKKTRQHIRKGLREGITVREGKKDDIETFFEFMLFTCQRQGVTPHPPEINFFEDMWQYFGKADHLKLFVAYHEGESLSSLLTIPFGERLSAWKIGWSGKKFRKRPNEVLYWEAIKWAKSSGYRYFDFMGIDPSMAEETEDRGGVNRERTTHGPTFFKLGFGGQRVLLPPACEYVANPLFRFCYHSLLRRFIDYPVTRKLIHRVWAKLNR